MYAYAAIVISGFCVAAFLFVNHHPWPAIAILLMIAGARYSNKDE